jgi:hypothetical protein
MDFLEAIGKLVSKETAGKIYNDALSGQGQTARKARHRCYEDRTIVARTATVWGSLSRSA